MLVEELMLRLVFWNWRVNAIIIIVFNCKRQFTLFYILEFIFVRDGVVAATGLIPNCS